MKRNSDDLHLESVHTAVRGRGRFHVSRLKGERSLSARIRERLDGVEGVRAVSASPVTGNVLVHYPPEMTPGRVLAILGRAVRECLAAGESGPLRPADVPERAPWHALGASETVARLGSSKSSGLTSRLAADRLKEIGANRLAAAKTRPALEILAGQFKSVPVVLLTGSAALSLVTGGTADAVMILAVVAANAYIGFATEAVAERALKELTRLGPKEAHVVRDGAARTIAAERVVPGDLVVLVPGAYVPADGRLLKAEALTVDESALTGESMPVAKSAGKLTGAQVPLAERVNMVYRGTVVTGGRGLAVVVATGTGTEIGHIQKLVDETDSSGTPLQRQLDEMSLQLVRLTGVIAGGVLGVGLLRGRGWVDMLKLSISLAIAAVPEGLPTVATTTLAYNVSRMRRRNVMIRQLGAVEALGAVSMICLDKTGTLTLNQMTVQRVVAGRARYDAEAGLPREPALVRLAEIAALCNETKLERKGELVGSATEVALATLARDVGHDLAALRRRFPLTGTKYRTERRQYMVTSHDIGRGRRLLAMKGNPVEVLALCSDYLVGVERHKLTRKARRAIAADNESMAGAGLRVLGFASAETRNGEKPRYVWLGQAGLADPIRSGMPALMETFHDAGIHTAMITGDQDATASAVGRKLNLSREGDLATFDASRLHDRDGIPDAPHVHVYSRVSPSHKLAIVRRLKKDGQVVAMVGDGVNDAPALKAADIGIAMGKRGTEVAREVAGVVLLEDNVADLVEGIALGRTTYENIRKSLRYLLSTNLSETLVVLGALAAGLGEPISPLQLLWLNLVSDVFPALALSLEPPEEGVMRRPPRDAAAPLVSRDDFGRIGLESLAMTAATLAAYACGVRRYGAGPRARTLGFATLTAAQLLHTISCRSETRSLFHGKKGERNPYLPMALATGFGLQAASLWLPPLRRALGVTPLGAGDLAVVLGAAGANFAMNELNRHLQSARARAAEISLKPTEERT